MTINVPFWISFNCSIDLNGNAFIRLKVELKSEFQSWHTAKIGEFCLGTEYINGSIRLFKRRRKKIIELKKWKCSSFGASMVFPLNGTVYKMKIMCAFEVFYLYECGHYSEISVQFGSTNGQLSDTFWHLNENLWVWWPPANHQAIV